MQSVEERKGVSPKSQLFDSLKVYLNNKNRLQPIIGLESIIECVNAGTHNREAFYLCEVCVCRLSKADIRSHIMGSIHRYNYVKALHPNLVSEWQENPDLSKLAWPLMEIATSLEGKEGPGDVQLFEFEDAVYQKMATHSENDAITLINILRDEQGQGKSDCLPETTSPLHYPNQSQRTVLLAQNQQRQAEKSFETSAKTNKPPSLVQSTAASSIKSEGGLNNTSMSLSDNTQMWPEPSVLSENSNTLLDDNTGDEPLIGLSRVVECRSEDGHTCCYLCHCCRIRSNRKDFFDHLTNPSHLMNYLMETIPEKVDEVMADINDDYQLLQSLAKKVEQEEGRGELKVVNAPESLCILLNEKSYHWCIKMLCNGQTYNQKRYTDVKGLSVHRTSNQAMPGKCPAVLSKRTKKMKTKRKMRTGSNTVFKVSLPSTKGSVLLERTTFSMDILPLSSGHSPSLVSDLRPLPKSPSHDSEMDCATRSCVVYNAEDASICTTGTTSKLQQVFESGDGDAGHYMGPEKNFTVSCYQEVDGYIRENDYFSRSVDLTRTRDQMFFGEQKVNGQLGSQERSSHRFYKERQNEGLQAAVYHRQDWPSYNPSYGREENCTSRQWCYPTSQNKSGIRVEISRDERRRQMSSDAAQHYYQQQPHNQYMAQGCTNVMTGSVGQHGWSGEAAAHLDAARVNTHPHLGDPYAHSGSIAPEPRVQFLETGQSNLQKYTEFSTGHEQTAPQSYAPQPTPNQAFQVDQRWMSNPNYNTGPWSNPYQHVHHPSVLWS